MTPIKGGLKLEGKKEATLVPWTSARSEPPRRIRIPLVDSKQSPAKPCVQKGDRVLLGQKIAEDKRRIALHASVSGEVTAVHSEIEILSDGKDESIPGMGHERRGWESLSPEEGIQILKDSGIELPSSRHGTLILNACESEPYLTSDYSLLMSHPVEILRGAEILRRLRGAKDVILALEDREEEVIELLKSKFFFHTEFHTRMEALPARYPQENEKILVRTLLGPGKKAEVWNAATVYAVYEAVVLQKPFYERIVTVGGECMAQPRNLWIRIGTPAEEAVKGARGFLRQPEKVILGGPMRGIAIPTLDHPILKDTRGLLGLPREVAPPRIH